jgi:putative ABC transport system permease protein
MFNDVWIRLRSLFRRDEVEGELDAELRFHFDQHVEKLVHAGVPLAEARRRARLEFGGIDQVKEECREARGTYWIETLAQDARYSLRMMHKNPGFTAVAVLTLALGIGATTAIFTAVYATLLAPLPYPQSDRLVMVWSKLQGHLALVSAADFTDWKRQSTAFEDLNAWATDDFNVATQDRPEMVDGIYATPGYFGMLGHPLFLGRNFLPKEGQPGNAHVVILAYRLWRRLGANPSIIGQTTQINGEPHMVVGVLPPPGIYAPGSVERWDEQLAVPLVFTPEQVGHDALDAVFVAGRLKPGVSIMEVQAEMDSLTATEAKDYPKSDKNLSAFVEPYKNAFLPPDRQSTLRLLLGAVGFLLLIACLNVANLLLAKGITRQKEVAIRGSLGAQRAAIFAQFVTESLVLAILGGLVGLAAGYAMLRTLLVVIPAHTLPAEADLRLNVPILVSMLAATTLCGVLFGCAPAWYASRLDPVRFIRDGGRSGVGVGRHRLRRLLVIAEFALALPLLAGAGLTIHSFRNLTHVDLGVRTDHILGFYLEPVSLLNQKDPTQIGSYYRRILASIAAVPGVSHVSAMSFLPLEDLHASMPFAIAGKPAYADPSLRPVADLQMVTPDYFRTFGIRIVKGRAFADADNAASPAVAMVNEAFANRFLEGLDPLDQRVVMEQVVPAQGELGPAIDWKIVGVFHTVKSRGFREDHPEIDIPFWRTAYPISGIGVRTVQDPATMIKSIATAVNTVDPGAALYTPRTMQQMHDEILANDRFTAILFASFALVALLLAAVGIHGVTSFSVAQRSHEIALRMALGAGRNRVVALVVKEGAVLACLGLSLGLVGAYFVGRVMQSILYGVGAIDFSTTGAVGLLLFLAALAACYLPARRATRVDPMIALRHE